MVVRVVGHAWREVKIVDLGRGLDAGEMTGEKHGEAFCEEVGSYPCLMTHIVACERGFVELDIDSVRRVSPVNWDLEGTRE